MRSAARIALATALLAGAGFGFLLWRGPEPGGIDDVYTALFGPADLGPVDFERMARSDSPNDALACPEGVCAAPVDIVTPVYDVPGARLREIVVEVASAEPRTDIVYASIREETDRFVARTGLMRYPDTIAARIYGAGPGRSRLALYSRSQIGYSDMGVNRARLERWLEEIERRVAAEAGVAS
ncbi:DUF1499 domain-containing protein [Salinarimonas ramus]|uniref:DUF1499 domain-containing protein n=1 Tax=Salinarimonas ramus TaxID=690164 RepID=A0A917V4J0_9HYPH|nr:DUF1499 domain-containing protein [Salinarimonas ramus]GGK35560.1 hypothetical protein GCM10011322_23030 [Salinarimonas ramus]